MIVIRSPVDLEKARLLPHLEIVARKHLHLILDTNPQYEPEDDGHLVIVTPTDTDLSLVQDLGQRWRNSMFEGVVFVPGSRCFVAVILRGNQFAVTILTPGEPWLDPAIRRRLLAEIDDRQPPTPST